MPLHEQLCGPGLAFLGERQRTLQLWNASLKQLYSKLFWFSEIRKSHKNVLQTFLTVFKKSQVVWGWGALGGLSDTVAFGYRSHVPTQIWWGASSPAPYMPLVQSHLWNSSGSPALIWAMGYRVNQTPSSMCAYLVGPFRLYSTRLSLTVVHPSADLLCNSVHNRGDDEQALCKADLFLIFCQSS